MKKDVCIVIAEDDKGHATLINKNLRRAGISNQILFFKNGKEVLDFFFKRGKGPHRESGTAYVLLLDIRMPIVNGDEVLRRLKNDFELRKIPVIMITTTDDPREVEVCYSLGCSSYIVKPINYDHFKEAITQLGSYLSQVEVSIVNGDLIEGT